MQIDAENYLAAADTDTEGEVEAKHSSLPLNRVIEVMEKADTTTNIIILDACCDRVRPPRHRTFVRRREPLKRPFVDLASERSGPLILCNRQRR